MHHLSADELTLRDLCNMPRKELLQSLQQFTAIFPLPLNVRQVNTLTDRDLLKLTNRARRKYHARGY